MNTNPDIRESIKRANLRGKKKEVGKYILDNHVECAFLTASELAERVGVSEPTVIRLATELGFSGYPDLQSALQSLCQQELTTLDRLEESENVEESADPGFQALSTDLDNLRKTLQGLDDETIHALVDEIIEADQVLVIGMGQAAPLASYFQKMLKTSLDHVVAITSNTAPYFEELVSATEDTLVFSIGFPRYVKRTVQCTKLAQQKGLFTAVLTDSQLSPLADHADLFLTARCRAISYIDSFTAPISLLGAIASTVAQERATDNKRKLEELEALWKQYGIFY
ncbi:MAG: MurR/RpiR family transcriptional regulator [Candidatus Bipolaricaulota bacterium]